MLTQVDSEAFPSQSAMDPRQFQARVGREGAYVLPDFTPSDADYRR